MIEKDLSSTRREFLYGTAAVLGAAAFGLGAVPVQAKTVVSTAPLSVAYWTGTKLVDARHLSAGDDSLTAVRLTIHGHQGGTALQAITAHFPIAGHSDSAFVPFHAWTAAPNSLSSRFTMPVAPSDGLLLSALGSGEAFCRFRTDAAHGQPKLHPGSYVLALGEPNWHVCCYDPEALHLPLGPLTQRTFSGLVPARFGYRVLTVEPA